MTETVYNKNGISFDIDAIATDLNGKADVDLVNVNDSGTSRCAGWAMPSTTYVALTAGASDTVYTAPANGYLVASGTSTNENNNHPLIWKLMQDDGTTEICTMVINSYAFMSGTISTFIPVQKNCKYKLTYGRMASVTVGFIYAQGSKWENS